MIVVWFTILAIIGFLCAYFSFRTWSYGMSLWSVWKESAFGTAHEEKDWEDIPVAPECSEDSETTRFSMCTAVACGNLIASMYDDNKITDTLHGNVVALFHDGVEKRWIGGVFRTKGTVWVAFRGSITMGDLVRNTDVVQVHLTDNKRVHHGFYVLYTRHIRPTWLRVWNSMDLSDVRRVVFTGYSLGAVLAALCMNERFLQDRFNTSQVCLYAFGSPRFGNYPFVYAIQEKGAVFSVINRHDIIPTMPLSVTMNFIQSSEPYLYAELQNIIYIDENHGNWKKNHSLRTYLSGLQNYYCDATGSPLKTIQRSIEEIPLQTHISSNGSCIGRR